MRPWLLSCLVLAGCAGARSTGTPTGALDAGGFRAGAGEYTFRLNRQYHGVVMVKLRDGRIARWREYQTESSLSFEEFSAATRF